MIMMMYRFAAFLLTLIYLQGHFRFCKPFELLWIYLQNIADTVNESE